MTVLRYQRVHSAETSELAVHVCLQAGCMCSCAGDRGLGGVPGRGARETGKEGTPAGGTKGARMGAASGLLGSSPAVTMGAAGGCAAGVERLGWPAKWAASKLLEQLLRAACMRQGWAMHGWGHARAWHGWDHGWG